MSYWQSGEVFLGLLCWVKAPPLRIIIKSFVNTIGGTHFEWSTGSATEIKVLKLITFNRSRPPARSIASLPATCRRSRPGSSSSWRGSEPWPTFSPRLLHFIYIKLVCMDTKLHANRSVFRENMPNRPHPRFERVSLENIHDKVIVVPLHVYDAFEKNSKPFLKFGPIFHKLRSFATSQLLPFLKQVLSWKLQS